VRSPPRQLLMASLSGRHLSSEGSIEPRSLLDGDGHEHDSDTAAHRLVHSLKRPTTCDDRAWRFTKEKPSAREPCEREREQVDEQGADEEDRNGSTHGGANAG